VFFPPIKKVKFEGEEKLAVEIPAQESSSSSLEGPTSSTGEAVVFISKDAALESALDTANPILVADTEAIPRTRNNTPPPEAIAPRKKRKVRNWEWTISSPRVPKQGDR